MKKKYIAAMFNRINLVGGSNSDRNTTVGKEVPGSHSVL